MSTAPDFTPTHVFDQTVKSVVDTINAKIPALVAGSVPMADGSGVKLYDQASGTYKGLTFQAEAPQVCSQPYLFAVAEGDITGHVPFEKFGRATGIVASDVDVWEGGTTYAFPASAVRLDIASSRCRSRSQRLQAVIALAALRGWIE